MPSTITRPRTSNHAFVVRTPNHTDTLLRVQIRIEREQVLQCLEVPTTTAGVGDEERIFRAMLEQAGEISLSAQALEEFARLTSGSVRAVELAREEAAEFLDWLRRNGGSAPGP